MVAIASIEQAIDVSLTVSVGLTQLQAGDSSGTILIRADKLMYEAKRKGCDTICVG